MRVVSGIQPTGMVHLGNYFGALVNWVALQNTGNECYFFIANQHAITLPSSVSDLKKNSLELAATLIAVGIDPEKSTLFLQSDVPEHAQLNWVLNCIAPLGQMERMIQFKEKSEQNPSAINLGCFSYPVLQAADVLLYKADCVPVGIDQAQHLELTRDLAHKFNTQYGEFFPLPQTLHSKTIKVLGLDGAAKMSKSRNNYIGLVEEPETILKKLKGAATDPARVRRQDPGTPEVCTIYALHKLISSELDTEFVAEGCRKATIGCSDCKGMLFKNLMNFLDPIRERYKELYSDKKALLDILQFGAEKARRVASKTLEEVYERVGFKL
jgi:tryptophanyl-tRNA synthetase